MILFYGNKDEKRKVFIIMLYIWSYDGKELHGLERKWNNSAKKPQYSLQDYGQQIWYRHWPYCKWEFYWTTIHTNIHTHIYLYLFALYMGKWYWILMDMLDMKMYTAKTEYAQGVLVGYSANEFRRNLSIVSSPGGFLFSKPKKINIAENT